jgi:tRNA (guanine-N7-)-methyltransferase
MRLRNDPNAKVKLDKHPEIVIQHPTQYKGKWKQIFNNDHPIHIEVGTGRGRFVTGMAQQNPHINYIGIEKFTTVIVKATENIANANLSNAKLLNVDAEDLLDIFEEGEIDGVYLNFSDPWPKNRHEKRRLTYKDFLKLYEQLMGGNGEVHLKTDNQALFEFSLESFSKYGMIVKNISLHLHASEFEGNVMTEYEQKFSEKGMRIYRCEAKYHSR